MSPGGLPADVLQVAGILALAAAAGRVVATALFPGGRGRALERWGWSVAASPLFLGGHVVVAFALGLRPGWPSFLASILVASLLSWLSRLAREERPPAAAALASSPGAWPFLALTVAGVAMALVRGLSEPMWSNDFLAVWGLKGKTIFGDAGIPQRLFRWPEFEFSNPGYPIGLPLTYAGIGFLLGRWDDHAMALLFPFFQVGTLLVLAGWLRRRGVGDLAALAASAFVANLGTLYSAWLTGMAEIPAAFAFLLVGTALWDVLDETDPGAVRRLAAAALLAAATKNEGLLLVATAGALLAFRAARRREPKWGVAAAAALLPGLGSWAAHRIVLGSHPVRGLDIGLLWAPGLGARVRETIKVEWGELVRPIWPGILAVVALAVLGTRRSRPNPILVLYSASLAIYLLLPILCPFGPLWLIHWTVGRIAGALIPLLAAGLAMGWRRDPHPNGGTPGSPPPPVRRLMK
jgi:hypothetical protein